MKVRLTLESTAGGVRATILEKGDTGERSDTFIVETVKQAKLRASTVARRHGLDRYGVVDRTKRAESQPRSDFAAK
jgi:hypothetical protein